MVDYTDPYFQPNQDELIELEATEGTSPIISDSQMSGRAFRAQYGLDTILKKSYDEIYSDLKAGNEDSMRMEAAAELSLRKSAVAEKALQEFAKNKQAPLAAEERQGLMKIIEDMRRGVDPTTVFEEAFGKRYLQTLDEVARRNPDNIWNDAMRMFPEQTARLSQIGSTTVAKNSFIETQIENIQAEIDAQGWLPWTVDQIKGIFGIYEESKLRGNVPTEGIQPLGFNLEEQRKQLMAMDWDSGEFKSKLESIVKSLSRDNPTMALEFLKAMRGLDPEEQIQKNLGVGFDFLGVPLISGLKKIGRGIKSLITGKPENLPKVDGPLTKFDRMTGEIKETQPFDKTFEQIREEHIQRALEQTTSTMGGMKWDDVVQGAAQQAVKDVVKASKEPNPTASTILENLGDVGEAAVQQATTHLVKYNNGIMDPLEAAEEGLLSAYKGIEDGIKTNTGTASRELVTRITDQFHSIRDRMMDALRDSQRIERLPEVMANETAVRAIKEDVKDKYPGLRNTILDIPRFFDETISNTRYAEIHMGRQDGELFSNPMVANAFRHVHGLKDFTIEAKGTGYYLKGYRPLEETGDTIRDLIGKTEGTQTPMGNLGNWFNYLRTPEETTSLAQRNNAKIATSVPSIAQEILKDSYKPIKALRGWFGYKSSAKWRDLSDVIQAAQDVRAADGTMGRFFDTIGDFEDFFMRSKGFLPDEQQTEAYFAFTRGMELDRMFRNIAEHKFMAREGAETHKVYATDATGKRVFSNDITGVARNRMAGGNDVVLIMDEKLGKERTVNIGKMAQSDWEEWDNLIKSGKKRMIEIWNPEHRPLENFGGVTNERIRYVIADGVETSQLKWDHVPRRGGGHVEYDYQYFIKQPSVIYETVGKTTRGWYEGDTTIMPIAIREMGKEVAGHLDNVRELLKAKNVDGARDYARKHMHIEWDTIHSWFKPKTIEGGKVIPARLNMNEKITVVERNRSVMKTDNEFAQKMAKRQAEEPNFEFRDGTTEGSLARQYQVAYTQERDAEKLFTVHSEAEGPLYKIADVEKVDPISTMNRALNRIAKTNYLDDYKITSVEHWLNDASKYLKLDHPNQIRYAPWKYFNDPEYLPGTPMHVKAALESSRAAINNLIGKPSVIDTWLDSTTANIVDGIYKKGGESAAIYSTKLLSNTSNPFTFMRGVVFHTKLGMYNVAQFLAQSMTYTNVWGIAGPKYAASSTYAAQLHFWSTLNGRKPILDHLDNMATKLQLPGAAKWKPGQFKESIIEGEKTGFFNVNNYALDNPFANKMVSTVFGDILESGTMFFKGGERNSKTVAWHTAYLEWRDANPFKKINNEERAKILERADLLNNNMTRASNSVMHTGVMSVPAQFYTYQLRATELLAGKRLTNTERLRLVFTNMLAYGVPVGAGVSGIPFADMDIPFIGNLRTYMKENGYIAGEKFLSTLAMEGLPSYLITMGTGKVYNVGDRLGAKGLDTINAVLRGDDVLWKTIGGAAGGVFKSTWTSMDGYWAWVNSMVGNGPHFPITGKDHLMLAREVSTVNNAATFYESLVTGRQISKKGDYLTDVTVADGMMKLLTGIQTQDVSDAFRISKHLGNQDQKWKKAMDWAQREVRDGMRAQDANNMEEADRRFTRAKAILERYDVPQRDRIKALSRAVTTEKSLVDRLKYDWYIRKAPESKQDQRHEDLRRLREYEKEKGNN